MSYNYLATRNGHNMYDMASMLQKAIRRGDVRLAGYAGMELFTSFHKYLWKRLLVISAEDVWGYNDKGNHRTISGRPNRKRRKK